MRNANRYICVCRIGEIRRNGKLVLPLPVGVALLQFTIAHSATCGTAIFTIYNLQFGLGRLGHLFLHV